ncbi:hypothetical protein FQN55_002161 [Onygenales sp. PD_40]|nr:hypothetical protein FQN55_002161 [Onygenales sp. PD_40]
MARHRREAPLEGLSNFSTPEPLPPSVRARAKQRFYSIIHHFKEVEPAQRSYPGYSRALLVRYLYEYSRSEISQDMVLRAFFDAMGLDMEVGNIDFDHDGDQLRESLASFAEFLIQGNNATDDEGRQIQGQKFVRLEVAHIVPHDLTQADSNNELNESKQAALRILNMVDHNISHPINGFSIGREFNAMSLASNLLIYFGKFQIFFDPVLREEHTYRIDAFLPSFILAEFQIPATRTLYPLHDRSIEPPSPRLLALHRAIAYILHLSRAGEYIDKILRDMEELVTLRLGGWLTGVANA